jgi:hypothetical protein
MSTPINNGGSAFPEHWKPLGQSGDSLRPGMSLRQHFAGLAMAAILGRADTFANGDRSEAGFEESVESLWREVAERAYQQADAMIAAGESK